MPEKSKSKKPKKKNKEPQEIKTEEIQDEEAEPTIKMVKGYFEAVGRRKTAIARVRISTSSPDQSIAEGNLVINNRLYKQYFPTLILQKLVESPFVRLKSINRFSGTVKVKGGGKNAQAEAVRHGLSRALILFDINFRKKLKKSGFLTRDSRKVERKKFGLKKARRAPQWSKR